MPGLREVSRALFAAELGGFANRIGDSCAGSRQERFAEKTELEHHNGKWTNLRTEIIARTKMVCINVARRTTGRHPVWSVRTPEIS
jgi:hypothetical protein